MKITLRNLTKQFEKNKKALDNLNIVFKSGKITGLIGFNGSGKTTTFNILSNFIEDYNGEVLFDNKKIKQEDRRKISYLGAGTDSKNPMKTITYLKDIAFLYNRPKNEVKKLIGDLAKTLEFTQFLNKPIKTLSKGNQQKIKVIISFLNPEAKVYLLDEPFDGLDPVMVEKIKKLYLGLKGATIIITSHRMDVVQSMCEEFFILKEGKLIDKKTESDTSIIVEVNKEVQTKLVKNMDFVLRIVKKDTTEILISNIKHFKELNKILLKDEKFIWISKKEKSISESLFKGYGV